MTIEEARAKRRELEANILQALRDFEKEVGILVYRVEIQRLVANDGSFDEIYSVSCGGQLGW